MRFLIATSTTRLALLAMLLAAGFYLRIPGELASNVAAVTTLRAYRTRDPTLARKAESQVKVAAAEGIWRPSEDRLEVEVALLRLNPRRAITALKQGDGYDPHSRLYAYWLGKAYEQAGQRDQATRILTAADLSGEALALATKLEAGGKTDAALAEYTRILRIAPSFEDARLRRGQLFEQIGQWHKAYSDLEAVLRSDPNSIGALVSLGYVDYRINNNLTRAVDYVNRAIQLSPRCAWCYLELSNLYSEAGQPEPALRACLTATRIDHSILCENS